MVSVGGASDVVVTVVAGGSVGELVLVAAIGNGHLPSVSRPLISSTERGSPV
ncbi:hypothetical protein GCM10027088_42850 [Nocardia goodfellowii]